MTNATVCATLRLSGDTIQGSCDRVRSLVELLAVGRDVPRADIDGALEELVGAGRRLRDAVAEGSRRLGAAEEQPTWTTASEMRSQTLSGCPSDTDSLVNRYSERATRNSSSGNPPAIARGGI